MDEDNDDAVSETRPDHQPPPPSSSHRNHYQLQTPDSMGVLREEAIELLVTSRLHFLELDLGPRIHGDRSDKADVNSEAAVLPRALQAHEHAVRHRCPLWILLSAVDNLKDAEKTGWCPCRWCLVWM
ncbi:unnamed protein product [Camellia sinensis]